MAVSLDQAPAYLSPSLALEASEKAPILLNRSLSSALPHPLSLFFTSETPGTWSVYENLFLSCLRTRDDKSARLCLEKLTDRFGASNERIMGLQGMYNEATAADGPALERILKSYKSTLDNDPTNMVRRDSPLRKPRAERSLADRQETSRSPEIHVSSSGGHHGAGGATGFKPH